MDVDCGVTGAFCLSVAPCPRHSAERELGHAACSETYCRNPLHPGPCKRWRTPTRTDRRRDTGDPAPEGGGGVPRRPAAPEPTGLPTGERGSDGFPPALVGESQGTPDRLRRFTDALRAQVTAWNAMDESYQAEAMAAMRSRQPLPDYRGRIAPNVGSRTNGAASAVQGFDAQPTIATEDQLDAAVEAGGVEIFRGSRDGYGLSGHQVTPDEVIEQIRSGPVYHGYGIYGNGMYYGTDEQIAREYAGGQRFTSPGGVAVGDGATVRAVLRPGSRVVEFGELRRIEREWIREMQDYALERKFSRKENQEWKHAIETATSDLGIFAAMMGYDAIHADEGNWAQSRGDSSRHWNIVNRGALLISAETGHVREGER